jgi:hypothetical protein
LEESVDGGGVASRIQPLDVDAVRPVSSRKNQNALIAAVVGSRRIPEASAVADVGRDELGTGFLALDRFDAVQLGPHADGVAAVMVEAAAPFEPVNSAAPGDIACEGFGLDSDPPPGIVSDPYWVPQLFVPKMSLDPTE